MLPMVDDTIAALSSAPAGGRNLRIWVYTRKGEYSVQLTFSGRSAASRLERIDVRFGLRSTPADRFIARYEDRLGPPDIRRRRAITASFGGGRHDQFDTIWSDHEWLPFPLKLCPRGKPYVTSVSTPTQSRQNAVGQRCDP